MTGGQSGDAPDVQEPSQRTLEAARWRARFVTVGLLVVIAFAVVNTVEAWPVTSFRLFSQIRTSKTTGFQLIAVDVDGVRHPVSVADDHAFARRTSSQLAKLPGLSAAERRSRVEGWLDAADLDHSAISVVILQRRQSVGRLTDSSRHDVKVRDVLRIPISR